MRGWRIVDQDGRTVDVIYYKWTCDESYIRSAEYLPEEFRLIPEE